MERSHSIARSILVPLAAVLAVGATPAHAQTTLEKILVLAPKPADPADSAYAVELASQVRDRMGTRMRHKLDVVSSKDVCSVLRQSGFSCDIVLSSADGERLARVLHADAFLDGTLRRDGGAPVLQAQLNNLTRSGLAGWVTVPGSPGDPAKDFAQVVVDSLENQIRAAEYARECVERRDRGDYQQARERAEHAFMLYPDHPAAALCASVVSEALKEPVDSQIAFLERAVRGDSLAARSWQRLGQLYNQHGDSLKALDAFIQQSQLTPGDRDLRLGVVAGAVTLGQYQSAMKLSEDWLASSPNDTAFIKLEARACVQGEMWKCALRALGRQYELDSSLATDSAFYPAIISAAQADGDTTAWLKWSGVAADRFPQSKAFLLSHADALGAAGMEDSVVAVYEHVLTLDPTDARIALRAAQLVLKGVVIDTATPLDTARLLRGGTLLNEAVVAARPGNDTTVMMNAALLYYQEGRGLIEKRMLIPTAVEWLERADSTDVRHALTQPVNFFLGLGLLYRIFEFDTEVTTSKSCDLVEQEAQMIARGKQAMQIGGAIAPSYAQQLMPRFQQMEDRVPQLRKAYKCPS